MGLYHLYKIWGWLFQGSENLNNDSAYKTIAETFGCITFS
jgi:hypothetical protein